MIILYFLLQGELMDGEEIAKCPSCSLMIRVIYDMDAFKQKTETSHLLTEPISA